MKKNWERFDLDAKDDFGIKAGASAIGSLSRDSRASCFTIYFWTFKRTTRTRGCIDITGEGILLGRLQDG